MRKNYAYWSGALGLLAALLAPPPASAQTAAPGWHWAQLISSPEPLRVTQTATDAAGNVFVLVSFQNSATLGPAATFPLGAGMSGALLAKYAPGGALLWARQLGGANQVQAHGLALDAAGHAYVCGTYGGTVALGNNQTLTSSDPSGHSFWARYNPQGVAEQAVQTAGSSGNDGVRSTNISVGPAGDVYVAGTFLGSVSFGGGVGLTGPSGSTAGARTAMFLARYSAAGTALWARQGGQSAPTGGLSDVRDVAVGPAGEAYLLGQLRGPTGGFGSTPALNPDFGRVVLVKYDGQGSLQWVQQGGTDNASALDWAGGLAADAAGSLYLAAHWGSAAQWNGTALPATAGRSNALLKLNPDAAGSTAWVRQLPGTNSGLGLLTDVALDAAANPYVVGSFEGSVQVDGRTLSSAGAADALVAAYSPQGALRWAQRGGGPHPDYATSLSVDAAGYPTVVGNFEQQAQFGTSTLVSQAAVQATNGFVARLGAGPTAVLPGAAPGALGLYPNPARNSVALPELPLGTRVQVLDAAGRRRSTLVTAAARASLPLAGWPAGLYLVHATAPGGQRWSGKLLVE